MTRTDIVKDFFKKTVLPVAIAGALFFAFKTIFTKDGEIDYFLAWIICGIPFGIRRMYLWLIPHSQASLQFTIGIWALNFIVGGIIGGFILVWRLVCAAWYLILTVYRLLTYNSASNRMTREVVQSAVTGFSEE